MHDIEQKINLFLEAACEGKAAFSEDLIQEFGERCKDILRTGFKEQPVGDRKFTLRMSNIGRSLRQLMLAKVNGNSWKPSKEFKLKSTIGHLYEAFFLTVMKQSGVNIVDQDKRVSMDINGTKLEGTYDVNIDNKIYDIKTASAFAYDSKFESIEKLKNNDSFGYFAQGFGYSIADGTPFGGWIALNKVTGNFKVLSVPDSEHEALSNEYRKKIIDTITHVTTSNEIPPCCGVIKESFFKKLTGNLILDRECEYCDFRFQCHPTLQALPDVNSKAVTKKIKYYIGKVIKPNASN